MIPPKKINGTRSNFNTAKVRRMSEVFPHAVIADKFIFLSGTAGLNPETGIIVSEKFEDQTKQCFLNIKTILEEAGSSMNNIVKTTIFMVSGNDFSTINKVLVAIKTQHSDNLKETKNEYHK